MPVSGPLMRWQVSRLADVRFPCRSARLPGPFGASGIGRPLRSRSRGRLCLRLDLSIWPCHIPFSPVTKQAPANPSCAQQTCESSKDATPCPKPPTLCAARQDCAGMPCQKGGRLAALLRPVSRMERACLASKCKAKQASIYRAQRQARAKGRLRQSPAPIACAVCRCSDTRNHTRARTARPPPWGRIGSGPRQRISHQQPHMSFAPPQPRPAGSYRGWR